MSHLWNAVKCMWRQVETFEFHHWSDLGKFCNMLINFNQIDESQWWLYWEQNDKKGPKIDILLHFGKAVISKWIQVQRYRFHYWLDLEKLFNLVIYFYWIGAGNVQISSKKWKESKFPPFTPLQNDSHYHSCLKGCQMSTKTGRDARISPHVRAWNDL